LGLCLTATRAAPGQPGINELMFKPPDVYVRVELLAEEIELVRREMGAPKESRPAVVVKGAQPRDNYFQGLNLCRKTQRLCFDMTGDQGTFPPPLPPLDEISPNDVFAVIHASLQNVRRVKTHFGIPELTREPKPDESKTPSDVFRAIVAANRQLSLMLDTRPTPTEVYEQLTEAVGAANRILARFPGAAVPKAPELERGKTPLDVHARLMRCVEQTHGLRKQLGQSLLEIDWRLAPDQVTPSDVHDLATLLAADLRYLESRLPPTNRAAALTDFPPGRKLPSHNFQRAGHLEAQLAEIRKQVEANPKLLMQNWTEASRSSSLTPMATGELKTPSP
jgi:hypothetical protein